MHGWTSADWPRWIFTVTWRARSGCPPSSIWPAGSDAAGGDDQRSWLPQAQVLAPLREAWSGALVELPSLPCPRTPTTVGQDLPCGVGARTTGDAASGVSPGAAQVQAGDGQPVPGLAEQRTPSEELV